MIINIRGCNGSGKSTVVKAILAMGKAKPIFGACGPARPEAYRLELPGVNRPLHVLGTYQSKNGGCDQLGSIVLAKELLLKYQPLGHVLLEGLIISGSYGQLCEALEAFGKQVIVVFLSTPFDVCIERLHARQAAGKARGEKHVKSHFDSVVGLRKKMLEKDVFQVVDASSDEAPQAIIKLLK